MQHSLILNKLRKYNICGYLLNWFKSLVSEDNELQYLVQHQKNVKLHQESPKAQSLGQMLFLLYVNDLPTAVKASKVACFADDTKVLKQIDNLQETVGLQNDINKRLKSWAIDNGLTFNETKCKCQRITRTKTPVESRV